MRVLNQRRKNTKVAKVYKNESPTCDIEKEKEIGIGFAVIPHTSKVIAICMNKFS